MLKYNANCLYINIFNFQHDLGSTFEALTMPRNTIVMDSLRTYGDAAKSGV